MAATTTGDHGPKNATASTGTTPQVEAQGTAHDMATVSTRWPHQAALPDCLNQPATAFPHRPANQRLSLQVAGGNSKFLGRL